MAKATSDKKAKGKAKATRKSPKATAKASKTAKKAVKKLASKKKAASKTTSKKAMRKVARKTAGKKAASKKATAKKTGAKRATSKSPVKKASRAKKATSRKTQADSQTAAASKQADSAIMQVEASKFDLRGRESYQGPPLVELQRDLPDSYGDTRLVLLPRDPEWIFAFWEVSLSIRNALGIPRFAHNKQMVLRVYDITGVEDFTGLNANSFVDVNINDHASSWYIRTEPRRHWCIDLGLINEEGEFVQIVRSNRVETPSNAISDVEDEQWVIPDEQYEKILGLSEGMLTSLLRNEETSRQLVPPHMHHEMPRPGASDQFMSGGSNVRFAPPQDEHKEAPLKFNTELVLYGSADPNAQLTVQGQKVHIEPDGSFSLRVELPEGQQEIPIEMTDKDGNLQHQVISLERRSED